MVRKENPALALARRQKRLQLWKEQLFEKSELRPEQLEPFKKLFAEYSRLIAQAVKAESDADRMAAESALTSIERELTSLFELHRLMTSSLGVPAVTSTK